MRAPRLVCGRRKQVSTVDTHEQWSGALSHRWRDAVTANFRFCAFTAFGLAALLCAPPQQFSGTARTETLLVTFVTEVSLRLAAPRTGGALIRRYIASRLALRSPDLFSSAPTTDQGERSPRGAPNIGPRCEIVTISDPLQGSRRTLLASRLPQIGSLRSEKPAPPAQPSGLF